MEKSKVNRFEVKKQLGEGSFSKIFKSFDKFNNKDVALKIEKEDKSKDILKYEYFILRDLQSLNNVPRVYEFVENPFLNFIVMELLGKNISSYKKSKGKNFTTIESIDILIQMLGCIEEVHNKGYIHRDIKPSNFVMDLTEKKVFIVDFGISKLHLDTQGNVFPKRAKVDFRGTLSYASLNSHQKIDLGRRDDLWSFFFTILDLLDEIIPWRLCGDDKDSIEKCKREYLNSPEKLLISTCKRKEIFEIFYHINSLKYEDRPNYAFIKNKLKEILIQEATKLKYLPLSDDAKSYSNEDYFNLFNKPFSTTSVETPREDPKPLIKNSVFYINKDFKKQKMLKNKRKRENPENYCKNKVNQRVKVNDSKKLLNNKIVKNTLGTINVINLENQMSFINTNKVGNYQSFDIQSYLYFIKILGIIELLKVNIFKSQTQTSATNMNNLSNDVFGNCMNFLPNIINNNNVI